MTDNFAQKKKDKYGVNTSTISTILSSKAKILEHYENSEFEDITKPKKSDFSSKDAIERINDLKDLFLNKKEDFSNKNVKPNNPVLQIL
ncbi:hypothetical protein BpHYR1_037515 [Brachionus plicatilis]|uniref:HTH psq-type domain-containing protein n=1 Tax=Brachionus plicatilis TaxID=10195 RepID=A0A3M7SQZ5_BRAPC|nr:hypothetical protein BpHYR1_037515 [Brachionus plicatilis]